MELYTEEMCYQAILNNDKSLEEYFNKENSNFQKLNMNYIIAKERNDCDLGKHIIKPNEIPLIMNYNKAYCRVHDINNKTAEEAIKLREELKKPVMIGDNNNLLPKIHPLERLSKIHELDMYIKKKVRE